MGSHTEYTVARDIHRNAEGEILSYNRYNDSVTSNLKSAELILKSARDFYPNYDWKIIERTVSAWKVQ